VEVQRLINADAATVWNFVGDFQNIDKWVPNVSTSVLEGDIENNTVGAKRFLTFPDNTSVRETLTAFDAENFTHTYIIPGSDIGTVSYSATITVRPEENGQSTLLWVANLETTPENKDIVHLMITNLFTSTADSVVEHFQQ
jgi:carbon monoxide dehydrogenase subunit G